MFVDYYALLEITPTATSEEIKAAFKKQAMRWHPDRNPGVDTNPQMQLINEAKLILLDEEARVKYDLQYSRFRQHQTEKEQFRKQEQQRKQEQHRRQEEQQKKQTTQDYKEETFTYSDFSVDDEVLKRWMANAKRQAVDLAKQTIEELKGMTKAGIKAGAKEIGRGFIFQIFLSIIVLIIIGISKSCN
ncbi:MAG TPA: J domain-containing protein [Bacteroidia bacterium]|nr:J domain-containing protein [Bacteroidia bacterium]